MRLDKYLKVSRIIKRRTVAKEACDGGRVTVNTDNMTVSGVTLSHELEKLDLTAEQAKQVAINAASAAFVDEDDRQLLLEQIEEIFA